MFLKAKTPKDYKLGKAYEPVLVNLLMPVEHQSQRDLSKKKKVVIFQMEVKITWEYFDHLLRPFDPMSSGTSCRVVPRGQAIKRQSQRK